MVHEVSRAADECCWVISTLLYFQEYIDDQVVELEAAQIVQEESARQSPQTSLDRSRHDERAGVVLMLHIAGLA